MDLILLILQTDLGFPTRQTLQRRRIRRRDPTLPIRLRRRTLLTLQRDLILLTHQILPTRRTLRRDLVLRILPTLQMDL
jgi:hypothetical protein